MLVIGIVFILLPNLLDDTYEIYNYIPFVITFTTILTLSVTGGDENHGLEIGLGKIKIYPLTHRRTYVLLLENEYLSIKGLIFFSQAIGFAVLSYKYSGILMAILSIALYTSFSIFIVHSILLLKLLFRKYLVNAFAIMSFTLLLLFQIQLITFKGSDQEQKLRLFSPFASWLWKGFQSLIEGNIAEVISYSMLYLVLSAILSLLFLYKQKRLEY